MPNFKELVKSWNKLSYPRRPNTDTINIIEKKLHNIKSLAILGSTPEFRLLAKQKGLESDVYDLSPEMLEVLSVDYKKEKRIQKNWYEIKKKKYDVILGDLIFGLIQSDKQMQLLQVMHNNLNEGGLFIFRNALQIEKPKLPISENVKKYTLKYGYINIAWNYISFELTIGYNYLNTDIVNALNDINSEAKEVFQKDFLNICPYGNMKYQNLAFQKWIKKSQYLFQKKHNSVQEELIIFSKEELNSILCIKQ